MRRPPDTLATAVRAFKELTAASDGAAPTRARVLDVADRAARRHLAPRRLLLPTVAGLLIICTAAIAGTTLARRWRQPATVAVTAPEAEATPLALGGRHARVVIPTIAAAAEAARPDEVLNAASDAESVAYGRAHRAHFDGADPARALAAWDQYLRSYPHGVFEPEARFNRALCLVRLGRAAEAERALRPFSEGRYGDYRRAEATTLIDWLPGSPPAP